MGQFHSLLIWVGWISVRFNQRKRKWANAKLNPPEPQILSCCGFFFFFLSHLLNAFLHFPGRWRMGKKMYWFSRAAITRCHRLGSLKPEKCIFPVPGARSLKTKMSARLIPSAGSQGDCSRPLTWLPVVCWQSLELLGLLRHHSARVFTCLFLVYVSVSQFFSSSKNTNHIGFKAHPNPVWPHLN